MVFAFGVVGFGIGLLMSYLIYPYPTPETGDASALKRLIVTAVITAIGAGLGKVVRSEKEDDMRANPTQGRTAKGSAAAEIKALADLRDRGLLTEAEFQAQKRKILSD